MQLSEQTLTILKNFAGINSNLVFKTGNTIKTVSESKTIMGQASVVESFPYEFGVYDLNEFLGIMSMFSQPNLSFSDDQKYVLIKEGNRQVKYFFSSTGFLTTPSKDISMPPCEVTFTLSAVDMANIRKATSALGVNNVMISVKEGKGANIIVTDISDPTSNSYEMKLGDCSYPDVDCEFVFDVGNFKFIVDDYDVCLSSKLISNFKAKNNPIEYWVALQSGKVNGG